MTERMDETLRREVSVEAEINHHLAVCEVLRDWGIPEDEAFDIARAYPVAHFAKRVAKGNLEKDGGGSQLRQRVEEKLIKHLQELPPANLKAPEGRALPKLRKQEDLVRSIAPQVVDHMVFALTRLSV